MRLTEAISCYNGTVNPTLWDGRFLLTHLDIEQAKKIRKAGLKARRKSKREGSELLF